jgi:ABC-2 type transport system ATP-binding protein
MRQRLGLAAALLGDPPVLLLDEPTNGLDAEGIRWLRTLLRELASEGRTVLVSSHLMGEVALTADHLLVIGGGRLLANTPARDFVSELAEHRLRVRTAQPERLRDLLAAAGAAVTIEADRALGISGISEERVGAVAARHGVPLLELGRDEPSLEEAFLALTAATGPHEGGRA